MRWRLFREGFGRARSRDAARGEHRGQRVRSSSADWAHPLQKPGSYPKKRTRFSGLDCEGGEESAQFITDVRLRTHELGFGGGKSDWDGVFKKNVIEETTLLALHGCWELVICCFMNAQMVSGCREGSASQGGSSPKQTT